MSIFTGNKLKSHWFTATFAIVGFMLLQGCSLMGMGMGMGWPGHMRSMMDSDYEVRGVTVEKIGTTGIRARLMIPSLIPGENSILSVQVSDPAFQKPVMATNVELSVRSEHSSVYLARLPDRAIPGYPGAVPSEFNKVYRFAYTPSESGILEVEAVVTYTGESVEDVLVLKAAQVIAGMRISRQRRSWLTGLAIAGGLSMLAMMAFFMGVGH